jgi:hypothetical protein
MPTYAPKGISFIDMIILYDSVAEAREEALKLGAKLASARARFKSVKACRASAKRRVENSLKIARERLADAGMIMDPVSTSAKRVRAAPQRRSRRLRKKPPKKETNRKAAGKVMGKGKQKAGTPPPDDEEDGEAEEEDGSEYVE